MSISTGSAVRWLALVVALLAPLAAVEVGAACTETADAAAVRKSITRDVKCNDKRFRKGPAAECSLAPPPACAGTLVDDAVALAYGPNDPPAAAVDTQGAPRPADLSENASGTASRATSAPSSAT